MPLLALPRCVLLPHATVPLTFHQADYCDVVREAMEGDRLVAVGLSTVDLIAGIEPFAARPHVCVAYVARHGRNETGGAVLLLQGVCRASIISQVSTDPCPKVLLDPVETSMVNDDDVASDRRRVESLLSDPSLKNLASVSAIHNWLNAEIPTAVLVDLAILTICTDSEQRYRMLAEPELSFRAQWLVTYLRETRRTLRVAERFRPPQLADCLQIN